MKTLLLVLLLTIPISTSVVEAETTGQDLHDWWQAFSRMEHGTASANDAVMGGRFTGYVDGVLDLYFLLEREKNYAFSLPSNARSGEIYAVVGKFLDDNPSFWSYPAEGIILIALTRSYPKGEAP